MRQLLNENKRDEVAWALLLLRTRCCVCVIFTARRQAIKAWDTHPAARILLRSRARDAEPASKPIAIEKAVHAMPSSRLSPISPTGTIARKTSLSL